MAEPHQIPRAPLFLGLAGLLPFLWGALGTILSPVSEMTVGLLGQRFNSPYILISYGTVILCFMSGVLWGFATRAETGQAAKAYALSTLPALWVFFTVGGGEGRALSALIVGFIFVFVCDVQFATWRLTPPWWIKLRALLTFIVLVCLAMGVLFS